MVQAATAGAASTLRFFQYRDRVRVEFVDLPEISIEDISEAISTTNKATHRVWLAELVIGLRQFLALPRLIFRIRAVQYEWDGEQFKSSSSKKQRFSGDVSLGIVVYRAPGTYTKFSLRACRQSLEEKQQLERRVIRSPLKILLDSRPLNRSGLDFSTQSKVTAGDSEENIIRTSLARGAVTTNELNSNSLSRKPVRAKARPGELPMEGKRSFLTWPEDEEEAIGFHLYFSLLKKIINVENEGFSVTLQPHRGEFVACVARLGVVAGKLALPLAPLGGFLQISCDGAQADLSGLSVRIRHADKVQASRALQALAPFLESTKNEILNYEPSSTDYLTASVPLLVGATVLFGGLGAIAGPVYGLLGASTGPIISFNTAKWDSAEKEHLKRQIVQAIGEMTKICSRRTHHWEIISEFH